MNTKKGTRNCPFFFTINSNLKLFICMNNLRQLIKEHLLLEKRIGQLLSNIKIQYSFDVDRTTHAYLRKDRPDLEDYNQKEISNHELRYFIDFFLRDIAENIATQQIIDNEEFVIKSVSKELAVAINPVQIGEYYWILELITVFRESKRNPFRTGKNQLVLRKD